MSELSKDTELCELLANIIGESHVNDILSEFETLEDMGKLQIVNDSLEKDHSKNRNQLRFGNVFYVSLKQLKNNIKNNLWIIGALILISKSKITTAIIQLITRILPCCHLIKPEHRCVFVRAVELFHQDNKRYYAIDDFYKIKEFSGECNYLTTDCSYRKNQFCNITEEDIQKSLNCLVEMSIIDRSVSSGYRYNKW